MIWEDKYEMVRLLNSGEYQEAVTFFGQQEDWDTQGCDMFITGMNLTKSELCLPISERILKVEASTLPGFRSQLRWSMLQVSLKELKEKPKNE